MGNTLERVKEQLNEFYQSLNQSQKIKILISVLLILLSMSLLFYTTSRPEYVTLFNDISVQEAGEITQKLDEMRIPWKSGNTSNSIMVPKDYLDRASMNLAVEGFPRERFSYDDFIDNSSITMTNEERTKRFLIAQKNSLASTIEEIQGVRSAWVDLFVPDDTNFLSPNQESKASIFVELVPGTTLNEQQVNGIVALVSNAVKSLEPENISVVDNRGFVLNKSSSNDSFDASTQLNLQQQVQNDLQDSILQFLSTVYGAGNVAVMVNVKLDFDSEITETKAFSPPIEGEESGLIRSMTELNERVVNDTLGGVPGTDSNVEDITQYAENSGDTSTYDKANQTINYELNEINQRIVKAQGQVRDITVGVIINRSSLVDQELTDEHRLQIVNLVSASAGLDTRVVEVMAQDFDTSLAEEFERAQQQTTGLQGIPLWSLGVIGALIVGGLGYSIYTMRKRKDKIDALIPNAATIDPNSVGEISLELTEKSGYKKQINKFVDRNPEAVAQLLKNWINEE